MGSKSNIEWTEATWNPIRGVKGNWHCTHVSEGCRNCYAERLNVRFGGPAYKPGADRLRLDDKILGDPLRWRRPRRIFVCSMTDLFHEKVEDGWIEAIFSTMSLASGHVFQVLTKRPQRMLDAVLGLAKFDDGTPRKRWPLPNVWLGVSAEDQKTADERIPLLLQTPAIVRWLSAEPLLGPIRLEQDWTDVQGESEFDVNPILNWVVVGGESGPAARPMHPDWAQSLRDQCQATGVPFFFKQWGEWQPIQYIGKESRSPLLKISVPQPDAIRKSTREIVFNSGQPGSGVNMLRMGKNAAGRLLDGREWNEYPDAQG